MEFQDESAPKCLIFNAKHMRCTVSISISDRNSVYLTHMRGRVFLEARTALRCLSEVQPVFGLIWIQTLRGGLRFPCSKGYGARSHQPLLLVLLARYSAAYIPKHMRSTASIYLIETAFAPYTATCIPPPVYMTVKALAFWVPGTWPALTRRWARLSCAALAQARKNHHTSGGCPHWWCDLSLKGAVAGRSGYGRSLEASEWA